MQANRTVLRHFLQVPLAVWRDQQAAAAANKPPPAEALRKPTTGSRKSLRKAPESAPASELGSSRKANQNVRLDPPRVPPLLFSKGCDL